MIHSPYVLIIDDDPDDADFLMNAFTAHYPNSRFKLCRNGKEGIDFLLNDEEAPDDCPELTFLDLHMPGKNGYDTLLELRRSGKCKDVPILIISTSLLPAEAEKCRAAGCTAYFSKPVSIQGYDDIVAKSMTYLTPSLNFPR